jgi:hypothetical protein
MKRYLWVLLALYLAWAGTCTLLVVYLTPAANQAAANLTAGLVDWIQGFIERWLS